MINLSFPASFLASPGSQHQQQLQEHFQQFLPFQQDASNLPRSFVGKYRNWSICKTYKFVLTKSAEDKVFARIIAVLPLPVLCIELVAFFCFK